MPRQNSKTAVASSKRWPQKEVIRGSNFVRLEKYANINNFLHFDRNTNGKNREVFFCPAWYLYTRGTTVLSSGNPNAVG